MNGRTATETAESVRDGSLTARAATEEALEAIKERDTGYGAFQEVLSGPALRDADLIDAMTDKSGLHLAGVPIAIKDNIAVAGVPMRDGSAGSDPTPQRSDHEVVRRLRAAGAIIVGVTRVPELCVFGTTDSTFGLTRNPWDRTRTPGGSSGGSAAAVAAGLVAVAHGNDGMGSIRIPAACCGLVGLKPGLGVVPNDIGNGSWFNMAENGPLATTVADCARMLAVMADDNRYLTSEEPGPLRIAVSTKMTTPLPLDSFWAAATRETATLLEKVGHTVSEASPNYGQRTSPSELARWFAGTELDAQLLTDRSKLQTRTRRHAAMGRVVQKLGLPKEKGRAAFRRRADAFFADYDVLLTPTLAQPPVESKAWSTRGWLSNVVSNARYAPYCAPWNLVGFPAMAVPAGIHPCGTPLSIQLVTRPGGESLLLGLARQLEHLRPWPRTAPA